jgi:uncharacterized membrane protein
MGQSGIILLQYLHIFAASTLIGTSLYLDFVLMPTILKRPAGEAKAFFEANLRPTSVLMAVSSGVTFLTGLIRGTFFGNIRSFGDLATTYGMTFSVALAVMLVMMVQGPRIAPHLLKTVWKGNKFAPGAQAAVKAAHRLPFWAVIILLACMVLMHFGL